MISKTIYQFDILPFRAALCDLLFLSKLSASLQYITTNEIITEYN